MPTLKVPTINDEPNDFDNLFQIWNQVIDDYSNVTFDFSECLFLRQNAVAFLGGLACLIESRHGNVTFDWDTLQHNIHTNLRQNGFMYAFNNAEKPWQGHSIPYRQDQEQDLGDIVNYLTNDWLGRDWMAVSPLLKNSIVTRVGEIYVNAFEHGRSDIGVFSCGQYYPNLKRLKLTTIDFGGGIPSNVRLFRGNAQLTASEAVKWALQKGNTTTNKNIARGLGLDLLSKFVTMNKGSLEIFSHYGYALIDQTGETYQERQTFFEGTLVNITLQCDERCYQCLPETDDEPLF
jgi:hypothetical protein